MGALYGQYYFVTPKPNETGLDINLCLDWLNRAAMAERLCLRLQRKQLAKPLFKLFTKSI